MDERQGAFDMLKKWKRENMKEKKLNKKNSGFTVLELIIVITIMAILVALIAPNLFSFYEKSRAAKDYNTLDGLYLAYSSAIAATDHPEAVKLNDAAVLNKVGYSTISEFEDNLESNQFESSNISCYYDSDKNEYGLYIPGQNGYTGVKIDNKGTKCLLGKKGQADCYVDETTKTEVQFVYE